MGDNNIILEDVKTLLEIEGDDRDKLIRVLISTVEKQILGKLQGMKVPPKMIPEPIEYIVVEMVIARYNKMGSEGLKSQTVEGYSATYNENDLDNYQSAIDDYIKSIDRDVSVNNRRVVRFI